MASKKNKPSSDPLDELTLPAAPLAEPEPDAAEAELPSTDPEESPEAENSPTADASPPTEPDFEPRLGEPCFTVICGTISDRWVEGDIVTEAELAAAPELGGVARLLEIGAITEGGS